VRRVRTDILERPLNVLVMRELARERARLLTAHAQDAVVRGEHGPVDEDNFLVIVVREDVVKGYVLCYVRIVHDEPDVLRAVEADLVPEDEHRLLVLMYGDLWLGEFRLKELPEVGKVTREL